MEEEDGVLRIVVQDASFSGSGEFTSKIKNKNFIVQAGLFNSIILTCFFGVGEVVGAAGQRGGSSLGTTKFF